MPCPSCSAQPAPFAVGHGLDDTDFDWVDDLPPLRSDHAKARIELTLRDRRNLAPSVVVIPEWVALALEHEVGNIATEEFECKRNRADKGIVWPGTDAAAEAWQVLAAALAQGGSKNGKTQNHG